MYRGSELIGVRHPNLRGEVFDHLLLSQPLGNASTLLVRHEVIDRVGGFDVNLPRGNDGDFIRRIAEFYKVEVIKEVLVHYYVDHGGHPRITGNDRQSILNGIKGHEAKLSKFSRALEMRPYYHAALLALIGRQYASLGDISSAIKNFTSALRIRPYSINVYLQIIKDCLEFAFKRA